MMAHPVLTRVPSMSPFGLTRLLLSLTLALPALARAEFQALTLSTPENREVIGDAGLVYETSEELTQRLQEVIDHPSMIGEYRRRAMARVIQYYNWEQITDQYEELLARLAHQELVRLPAIEAEANREASEEDLVGPLAIAGSHGNVARKATGLPS